MKKLMTKIVLLVVGLMAWGMLIAPSSQALNTYYTNQYYCYNGYGYYDRYLVYDYNWWEESWLGGSKRDYRRYIGTYRAPSMDGFCRGITVA